MAVVKLAQGTTVSKRLIQGPVRDPIGVVVGQADMQDQRPGPILLDRQAPGIVVEPNHVALLEDGAASLHSLPRAFEQFRSPVFQQRRQMKPLPAKMALNPIGIAVARNLRLSANRPRDAALLREIFEDVLRRLWPGSKPGNKEAGWVARPEVRRRAWGISHALRRTSGRATRNTALLNQAAAFSMPGWQAGKKM